MLVCKALSGQEGCLRWLPWVGDTCLCPPTSNQSCFYLSSTHTCAWGCMCMFGRKKLVCIFTRTRRVNSNIPLSHLRSQRLRICRQGIWQGIRLPWTFQEQWLLYFKKFMWCQKGQKSLEVSSLTAALKIPPNAKCSPLHQRNTLKTGVQATDASIIWTGVFLFLFC